MLNKIKAYLPQIKECSWTLAGVFLFWSVKNRWHEGFGVILFAIIGILLTAIGVMKTLQSDKTQRDKIIALVVHAGCWILGKIIFVIIAWFIVFLIGGFLMKIKEAWDHPETTQEDSGDFTLSNLPGSLYSGSTWYKCSNRSGAGVEYVNSADANDRILIRTVYDHTGDSISTDAGYFNF